MTASGLGFMADAFIAWALATSSQDRPAAGAGRRGYPLNIIAVHKRWR